MRTIWIFGLLAAFWQLLSGHTNALLIELGLLSIIFVMALGRRMHRAAAIQQYEPQTTADDRAGGRIGSSLQRLATIGRYCRYAIWLTKEIILSNIDVARQVWSPNRTIEPSVLILPEEDLDDVQKVIYANSITLTPGTVSLFVRDDGIHVHALTQQAANALKDGEMKRRVKQL